MADLCRNCMGTAEDRWLLVRRKKFFWVPDLGPVADNPDILGNNPDILGNNPDILGNNPDTSG